MKQFSNMLCWMVPRFTFVLFLQCPVENTALVCFYSMSATNRTRYFTILHGILHAHQLSSNPPKAIYPLLLTLAGDPGIRVTGRFPHNIWLPLQALEFACTTGTDIRCSEPKCHLVTGGDSPESRLITRGQVLGWVNQIPVLCLKNVLPSHSSQLPVSTARFYRSQQWVQGSGAHQLLSFGRDSDRKNDRWSVSSPVCILWVLTIAAYPISEIIDNPEKEEILFPCARWKSVSKCPYMSLIHKWHIKFRGTTSPISHYCFQWN